MIPRFDEIRIEALKLLRNNETLTNKDFRLPLAKHFQLSEQEQNAEYESGNGNIFSDRISWALSYLYIAGLAEKPQRGVYKISDRGKEMLENCTEQDINKYVNNVVQETMQSVHKEKSKKSGKAVDSHTTTNFIDTPSEQLLQSFNQLKKSISSDILTTIIKKKPKDQIAASNGIWRRNQRFRSCNKIEQGWRY